MSEQYIASQNDSSVYDWQAACGGSPEAAQEAREQGDAARIYAETHRNPQEIPSNITQLVNTYHNAWYKANQTRNDADINNALKLGEALENHPDHFIEDACPENSHGEATYPQSRIY